MDRCLLNNRGFSLLEWVCVMLAMAGILAMVMSGIMQRVQNAQFGKTVQEMKSIAQASINFYVAQGICPTGINQLAPLYMPQAVLTSPFNSAYQLSCTGNLISVSDSVPAGLAQKNPQGPLLQVSSSGGQDNITITQSLPYSFTARLLYDKKYLYNGS